MLFHVLLAKNQNLRNCERVFFIKNARMPWGNIISWFLFNRVQSRVCVFGWVHVEKNQSLIIILLPDSLRNCIFFRVNDLWLECSMKRREGRGKFFSIWFAIILGLLINSIMGLIGSKRPFSYRKRRLSIAISLQLRHEMIAWPDQTRAERAAEDRGGVFELSEIQSVALCSA